jgi:hypothetical protein
MYSGADWPYNEVGKIPRGPLVWGPLRQSGAPQHHDLVFFFLDHLNSWEFPVWAAAVAPFFGQHFRFGKHFFGGPSKKNPTKIWGPSPPLHVLIIYLLSSCCISIKKKYVAYPQEDFLFIKLITSLRISLLKNCKKDFQFHIKTTESKFFYTKYKIFFTRLI